MQNDRPPRNTICQVRGCKAGAESYIQHPTFNKIPICGLHLALYRAWRDKNKEEK